ncbi:MAG TPA: PPC domain-containing DNA-binding protein [Woeseiaceae bacterium]|nr:PPC domain-containing DNA-binding protein [Woeseiaceae bacterium]
MQQQLLNDEGTRTWAVILDTGDEVTGCLLGFASSQGLSAAHLTAIGAFEHATLGYFDWQRKDYRRIPVEVQAEVVSLIGDVARAGKEPKLHMHAALGLADGSMCGGHLLNGVVRPTLEVIVTETPSWLRRQHDPETGLALIRAMPAR